MLFISSEFTERSSDTPRAALSPSRGATRRVAAQTACALDDGVNGGIDRRRHVRVGVATAVTYLLEGAACERAGKSSDIGGGGMRLATNEDLPIGTLLLLRFLLPKSSRELTARGRIVMSFYEAESRQYKHGIAFTQIEPDRSEEIARYVTSEVQLLSIDVR